MTYTIQLRRDTASNWTTDNPVLSSGEVGIETDTGKAKLGTGTITWNSLPYWNPGGQAGGVSSVFGRNGAVAAQSGDYTAAQVGAQALNPWQFMPESYGAKGDGKVLGDVGIATGTSTLTSATANFTSADTGKWIMVNGAAGNNAFPLVAQITYVNATTVTTSVAATSTVVNTNAIYGTDDTAAINSAISAAFTWGQANGNKVQIIFKPNKYILAATPVVTGTFGSTLSYYTQIPIPIPSANGTTEKFVIELLGVGAAEDNEYWLGTVPSLPGSCLVSMANAPSLVGGTEPPSVIGGPSGSGGLSGGFANAKCYVDGLTVAIPFLSNLYAYDFSRLGGAGGGRFKATAFAAVNGTYSNIGSLPGLAGFQNSGGLAMPVTANNDDCTVGSFTAEGTAFGVLAAEHATFERLSAIYTFTGLIVAGSGNPTHGVSILYYTCEASKQALSCGTGGQIPIFIGLMDTEVISTWDITDVNNSLTGVVNWADFERTTMNVNGASNLKIVNCRLGPGPVASPTSPPANNAAWTNTYYRDAWITLTATTITAVKIDSVAQGIAGSPAMYSVLVPGGHTYTPTFTGTLAHTVSLL